MLALGLFSRFPAVQILKWKRDVCSRKCETKFRSWDYCATTRKFLPFHETEERGRRFRYSAGWSLGTGLETLLCQRDQILGMLGFKCSEQANTLRWSNRVIDLLERLPGKLTAPAVAQQSTGTFGVETCSAESVGKGTNEINFNTYGKKVKNNKRKFRQRNDA